MSMEWHELNEKGFLLSYFNSNFNDVRDSLIQIEIHYCSDGTIRRIAKNAVIAFVMKGKIKISCGCAENLILSKGKLFLIPADTLAAIRCLETSSIVFCHLRESIELRECLAFENLYDIGSQNTIAPESNEFITFEANEQIRYFMEGLIPFVRGNKYCEQYYETKLEELLFLMRIYYPEGRLADFFYPVFNVDYVFRTQILKNRNKVFTVNELARITNCSLTAFRVRFKEVFKVTPSEWLNRERANLIYHELKSTNKPIKQICEESGFLSLSCFSKFCNKHLEKSPSSIRGKATETKYDKACAI